MVHYCKWFVVFGVTMGVIAPDADMSALILCFTLTTAGSFQSFAQRHLHRHHSSRAVLAIVISSVCFSVSAVFYVMATAVEDTYPTRRLTADPTMHGRSLSATSFNAFMTAGAYPSECSWRIDNGATYAYSASPRLHVQAHLLAHK